MEAISISDLLRRGVIKRFFRLLYSCLLLPVFAAPINSFAKGGVSEYRVSLRNGVLLNALDVHNRIAANKGMKSTFQQSLGVSYTRLKLSGLLFSSGADLGYERYDLDIDNYPYEANQFFAPAVKEETYRQKKTIPYAQLNFTLGYRVKGSKYKPEVRLGQVIHFPLAYTTFQERPTATSMLSGFTDPVLLVSGKYGKYGSGFTMELLNCAYLGCSIPTRDRRSLALESMFKGNFT